MTYTIAFEGRNYQATNKILSENGKLIYNAARGSMNADQLERLRKTVRIQDNEGKTYCGGKDTSGAFYITFELELMEHMGFAWESA